MICVLPAFSQENTVMDYDLSTVEAEWVRDTICPGFVYHKYQGMDSISGASQFVNVLEIDLNDPRYLIRFDYDKANLTTSASCDKHNAVAAINATYEPQSVFIRTAGTTWSAIPNRWVMKTPVPQWRNDGGVYCDKTGRKVRIESAGQGLNLEQTRKIYEKRSRRWPNVFTSSPVLIDDYQPVGETFAEFGFSEKQISLIHYEDPLRHQHVRHPRSAVALGSNNHLLLITVDGRWPGFAEGMNACELTKFLRKHFNPRYALNLDGGGSTTMVVKGRGEPATGVVNYPTDNRVFDHNGQRGTCTHICVIDTQR